MADGIKGVTQKGKKLFEVPLFLSDSNFHVTATLKNLSDLEGGGFTRSKRPDIEQGALKSFLDAQKKRQSRFRETQGLFTTGLNLSRLRALSSLGG